MEERELIQKDVETAPLRLLVRATLADGSEITSTTFMSTEDWDRLTPLQRQDEIQDGLQAMSDAVLGQICKRDLTV